MHKRIIFLMSCVLLFSFSSIWSEAQTNAQNVYISSADDELSIKTIVLTPTTDNVGGIYAKPIFEELQKIVNSDKQWNLKIAEAPQSKSLLDSPAEAVRIMRATDSQAALESHIIKGPKGISLTFNMFTERTGLPLLSETTTDIKGFETADLKIEAAKLFESLKSRMPYRGTILSRRGQQVTLNLGSAYGLKVDSKLTAVQIIRINRHPKLHVMVGTEREVLGRIKLFKVEPYLSFGYVEMEREPGLLQAGSKLVPDEFYKYATPVTVAGGKVLQDISSRPDAELAFGDNPSEWLPSSPPQFGKLEVLAGLASYNQKANFKSGESASANSYMPSILLRGELWLNPNWYVGLFTRQGITTLDNDLAGSSPGSLNLAMSSYGVSLGYNLLLTDDYFGPKMQIAGGYTTTKFTVDKSQPLAFSSMEYSGLHLSISGQFPLSPELPIDIGGKLDFYINPSLSENVSSGSSSNQMNTFSFFMDYRMQTRFKIRGELMFENYSSDFSGTTSRNPQPDSASHGVSSLLLGIQYLF